MSNLHKLNKDELIKIICTVNYAELEKQVTELDNKYYHLIDQCRNFGSIEMMECDICNCIDLVDVTKDSDNILMCDYCGNTYHYNCKSICFNCLVCSDCSDEYFQELNGTKYCDSCYEILYKK